MVPRSSPSTRERILDRAVKLASTTGLGGLTIGILADALSLSKSGLYAHFENKEDLQIEVLRHAASDFTQFVVRPALELPRGAPRVQALLDGWLEWSAHGPLPGGCLFVAAAVELDDQEGLVRDQLYYFQTEWLRVLARAAAVAVEEGHFAPATDPEQVAFEMHGILLSFHHQARLLRAPLARERAQAAIARLLTSLSSTPLPERLPRRRNTSNSSPNSKTRGKR